MWLRTPPPAKRLRLPADSLRPWDAPGGLRRKIPDLEDKAQARLAQGDARRAVVVTLLGCRHRTEAEVAAAAEFSIAKSTRYGIIARYRKEGSLTSSIPHAYRLRKRKKRLAAGVEEIIAASIRDL